jgi:hypothetical protein
LRNANVEDHKYLYVKLNQKELIMISFTQLKEIAVKYEKEVGAGVRHFCHYVEEEFKRLEAFVEGKDEAPAADPVAVAPVVEAPAADPVAVAPVVEAPAVADPVVEAPVVEAPAAPVHVFTAGPVDAAPADDHPA